MPITGRLILLTLAAGWLTAECWSARGRRAFLRDPAGRVGQLDLADRTAEPLVRRDLPPDRDDSHENEDTRRVVERLPLELLVGERPARRRERQREADHAD